MFAFVVTFHLDVAIIIYFVTWLSLQIKELRSKVFLHMLVIFPFTHSFGAWFLFNVTVIFFHTFVTRIYFTFMHKHIFFDIIICI